MHKNKILYHLGLFCAVHKYLILLSVSLLTVISSYFAVQLELNLGILSLFDDNDPVVEQVHYANNNFGGMDYTFISVKAGTLPNAKKFADTLAETIAKNDMVLRVVHKLDVTALMEYGFLFLNPQELLDLKNHMDIHQQDIVKLFQNIDTAGFLAGFNRMIERQIIVKNDITDPGRISNILASFDNFLMVMEDYITLDNAGDNYKLKRSLQKIFFQGLSDSNSVFEDEYMLSMDKRSVLLLVMPVKPGGDMSFIHEFMNYLNTTVADIAAGIPGASFQIGGNAAIINDEYNAVRRDAALSTGVTAILVFFIFFVFFRKLSDLLLIAICLIVGILWTCCLTKLSIGFLGFTTAFFSAILIGLGIDFAIHLLVRYSEYRNRGISVDHSVACAMAGSGPGILIGSGTTATAFFVLMTCRFNGISQLGFVSGIGILCVTIVILTLLPCMISIRDSKNACGPEKSLQTVRELFVLSDLSRFMVRHRWLALFLIAFITFIMSVFALRIEFNYDFRSLEPIDSAAIDANHHIGNEFGRSVDYAIVFADSVGQSRELANILTTKGSVERVNNIADFIPLRQPEKIQIIKQVEPLLTPVVVDKKPVPGKIMDNTGISDLVFSLQESSRMIKAVKQIAIVNGNIHIEDKSTQIMAHTLKLAGNIETVGPDRRKSLSHFQQILADELQDLLKKLKQAAKGDRLGIDQLPQAIRDNFIGKDGRMILYVYPKGYIWTKTILDQITKDLRSVTHESTSSGIVFLELVNKLKKDFKRAIGLSLLMVFILVFISFRSLMTSILALVPLILGTVWMLGTMKILGLTFNVVNVAVIPLIIGIGIDDGVHLIWRYRTESSDRIRIAIQHTGRAIFLTSITTMAGFGSLGLASYTAIATLGWVMLIGIFYCLFATIIIYPVLLSTLERFKPDMS